MDFSCCGGGTSPESMILRRKDSNINYGLSFPAFSENLTFSIALIFASGSFFISAMNYSIIGHFFGIKKFSNYFNRPKNIINLVFAGLFIFVAIEIWVLS